MATLMSLSNELLSKILRHTIPSNVIQSEYVADRCEQKDRHYRDWKSSTPVSRRYFLVARNAFFRAYTHRVRIMYPYPMSLGLGFAPPQVRDGAATGRDQTRDPGVADLRAGAVAGESGGGCRGH
ncbi:hypothetical protein LTR53_012507 [Teratosphaeriaceae sp. CCFEE 6253]|nr:hypothetical protein LTR53_012507 [Teratosphaeriaceae sp. CCFEE 6253]